MSIHLVDHRRGAIDFVLTMRDALVPRGELASFIIRITRRDDRITDDFIYYRISVSQKRNIGHLRIELP